MIEVDLPTGGAAGSLLLRSFTACLASVTETPEHALPDEPAPDLAEAVRVWRTWLAARGLGLVEVGQPAGFTMPGYWIAVVAGAEPGGPSAALVFGTPPGIVLGPGRPDLVGRAAADLPVERGFVLAALDPAVRADAAADRTVLRGRVEAIAVADRATAPMRLVPSAQALAGHGLAGDRYAQHAGTFTPARRTTRGYDLTLIEAEAVDALTAGDVQLAYAEARRNLVTRGIDLNALVGRRFRVGDVECLGQRLCEPCIHLERLTERGVLRGLIHRGGLRADVLTDGTITAGATIEALDDPDGPPGSY